MVFLFRKQKLAREWYRQIDKQTSRRTSTYTGWIKSLQTVSSRLQLN